MQHFEHREEGGRRLHQRASREEIEVCRPYLDLELDALRPRAVVALGLTAAGVLLGRQVRLADVAGQVLRGVGGYAVVPAPHPSAVLRAVGSARSRRSLPTYPRASYSAHRTRAVAYPR